MRMVGFDIFAPTSSQTRDCKVWRENWPSVMFFNDFCQTQWRYVAGMGGGMATGLDHTAVISSLRTLRLPRKDFDRIFSDVRVMEVAALKAMGQRASASSG